MDRTGDHVVARQLSGEAPLIGGGSSTALAWGGFWAVFLGLAAFDMLCLAPRGGAGKLTSRASVLHCVFWFLVGLVFNAGIYGTMGSAPAVAWLNGYILEYLLSVDNVFFFQVVFTAYATPASQVYKALYLGVLGAIVLRCLFYFLGGELFGLSFVVQVAFGLVLMYSAYQTVFSNDEDEDPRENRLVRVIRRCLPLTESYDDSGSLFVRVPLASEEAPRSSTPHSAAQPAAEVTGERDMEAGVAAPASPAGSASPRRGADSQEKPAAPSAGRAEGTDSGRMAWRGTLLLLVVVVLQVVDVLFAVDSVTAKIAEHDDIFLNFTSSAFAMLCLRSLYFVLEEMLSFFRFLKYGVAMVLFMIGAKLIVSPWVEVPGMISLAFMCVCFVVSMLLSVALPEPQEDKGEGAQDEDVEAASAAEEEEQAHGPGIGARKPGQETAATDSTPSSLDDLESSFSEPSAEQEQAAVSGR